MPFSWSVLCALCFVSGWQLCYYVCFMFVAPVRCYICMFYRVAVATSNFCIYFSCYFFVCGCELVKMLQNTAFFRSFSFCNTEWQINFELIWNKFERKFLTEIDVAYSTLFLNSRHRTAFSTLYRSVICIYRHRDNIVSINFYCFEKLLVLEDF